MKHGHDDVESVRVGEIKTRNNLRGVRITIFEGENDSAAFEAVPGLAGLGLVVFKVYLAILGRPGGAGNSHHLVKLLGNLTTIQ